MENVLVLTNFSIDPNLHLHLDQGPTIKSLGHIANHYTINAQASHNYNLHHQIRSRRVSQSKLYLQTPRPVQAPPPFHHSIFTGFCRRRPNQR
jgi:hypothetical protein